MANSPTTIDTSSPITGQRRVALVVEYDGTAYMGFQLQSHHPTIQAALEQALAKFTGENIRIRGASRTDSGAHAVGQVVDFLTDTRHPLDHFPRALNFYLSTDIIVQAAYEMSLDFHSRWDACSRIYRYNILNREWASPVKRHDHHWVKQPLNIENMADAAQALIGVHDFRPFGTGHPADKSAVRQVTRWDVSRKGDTIVIESEASGFLRHQIRRVNGLLIEIGRGLQSIGSVKAVLENNLPEGKEWTSLPAKGLCLVQVNYQDFWSKVRSSYETE